jgi:hypothetical protein
MQSLHCTLVHPMQGDVSYHAAVVEKQGIWYRCDAGGIQPIPEPTESVGDSDLYIFSREVGCGYLRQHHDGRDALLVH